MIGRHGLSRKRFMKAQGYSVIHKNLEIKKICLKTWENLLSDAIKIENFPRPQPLHAKTAFFRKQSALEIFYEIFFK